MAADETEAQTVEQLEELEAEPTGNEIDIDPTEESDAPNEYFSSVAPPDRRLITQPYDLAVGDLVDQVASKNLKLNPVYQRRYVWDNKKASKLVESLLINVPIPVCYLAEEPDGTRSTIDGQQRLRSLYRYLENEFTLTGLEVLPELNRLRFFELQERQQRLIRNRTIRCIVISEDSDPEIRFDVFERLNTGSVALTAQELRNSVYRGPLNLLLHELAGSEDLKRCVAGRSDSRMTFEELVLRYFALSERIVEYRPNLKAFLNRYMRDYQHSDPETLLELANRFRDATSKAYAVFGEKCFRRATGPVSAYSWLPTINSAVYDAVMINLGALKEDAMELAARAVEISDMTAVLMLENEPFIDAISLSTGDRARLHRRVRMYSTALKSIGLDAGLDLTIPDPG